MQQYLATIKSNPNDNSSSSSSNIKGNNIIFQSQPIQTESSSNYNSHVKFEPSFTNFTGNYVGCLDYLFFSFDMLNLSGFRPPLNEASLIKEAEVNQFQSYFLPSPIRPSDHLPLEAEFSWKH